MEPFSSLSIARIYEAVDAGLDATRNRKREIAIMVFLGALHAHGYMITEIPAGTVVPTIEPSVEAEG